MIIKRIKTRGNNYEVIFSDDQTLILPEDLMVNHRLIKDKEVSTELYEKLLIEAETHKIYLKALNYVKVPKSTYLVKQYLYSKGATKEQILLIVEKLNYLNLLDDNTYAKEIARKKMSTTQLIFELKQKGIKQEMIDTLADKNDEEAVLIDIVNKNIKRYIDKPDGKVKMYRYLISKGFSYSLVSKIVDKYFK